jgi:hypothetical protein
MKKFQILLKIVFCIMVFLSLSKASLVPAFNAEGYTTFIKDEIKIWNVPGAAILVIVDGRVVFSEGFGYRDRVQKGEII